jgi:hypothetical protein
MADSDSEMIERILRCRVDGAEQADLEESVLGTPRRYILMAYETYPNGSTGDAVTDPLLAHEIGKATGLGDPTDPNGWGIWEVAG